MATFDVGLLFSAIDNTKGAFRSVDRNLDKLDKKSQKTGKSLRAIQAVFASIAIGAGVQFAKSIANTVGEMELLITRLATFEGGTKRAREVLAQLQKDFGATPFSIDQVASSLGRLRAAGLSLDESNQILKAGTDAVAAFGGTTQELNRLIIGMTQAIGKGTLSMEEMRQQIGEAVPAAMRILSREYDISIGELFRRIESGAVDSREAMLLLAQGMEKDFKGSAQRAGAGIIGTLNAVSGEIKITLEEAFNVDTQAGRRTVELIREVAEGIKRFIQSITVRDVENFFDALKAGAAVVGTLVKVLREIINVLSSFTAAIHALLGDFGTTILVGGAIGLLLFGKNPISFFTGGILKIGGAVKDVGRVANIAAAGKYGLLGKVLFGALGPAAIVAAVATTMFAVGKMLQEKNADNALISNLRARVVRAVGEGGPEAAKKLLEGFKAEIQKSQQGLGGVADNIKSFFGLGADKGAALKEIDTLLGELTKGTGDWVVKLKEANALVGNAQESFRNFGGKALFTAVEKLEKLNNRIATTNFTFGSQTGNKLRQQIEALQKVRDQEQKKLDKAVAEGGIGAPNSTTRKNYEGIVKTLADMTKRINDAKKALGAGEANAFAVFAKETALRFDKAEQAVGKFTAKTGTELDQAIAKINAKKADLILQLEKVAKRYEMMGAKGKEGLAAINALKQQVINSTKEQIATEEKLFAIQQKQMILQMQGTRMDIERRMGDLRQQTASPLAQAFTEGGLANAAEQARLDLKREILSTDQQIEELRARALSPEATEAEKSQIAQTIELLGQQRALQVEAMQNITAEGMLAKQTWMELGGILQNTVSQGLFDMIKGTFDAKQALTSMYDEITKMAINYLVELIKIKIQKMIIAAINIGTGGAGGGFLSFLAADGIVAKGGLQKFADGGIIRGPTMFGLAGEAGDEAIMPLTRVGGKLGVRAEGNMGGGDSFNVTIQAIDTQTGAQFLHKNADTIMGSLRQSSRLNKGGIR